MAGRNIGNFKIALHFCNRVAFQFDQSACRPVGYGYSYTPGATVIAVTGATRWLAKDEPAREIY